MNNLFRSIVFALLVTLLFSACDKKEYQTIEELDDSNIQNYIQKNNLGGQVQQYKETGLYYSIIQEGTGKELSYEDKVPLVFTFKTLDGSYSAADTFSSANRYYDYLGYFPYGSSGANAPGAPLDKETGMKLLLKEVLKKANGRIRIIVPSRMAFGRNGNKFVPPNASIDYVVTAIDVESLSEYEDESIRKYMIANSLQPDDFEKTSTGIYYRINELGTGDFVSEEKRFSVAYDLKFLDGETFQKADSATFELKGVIPAWQEVMPKVKNKGKVRMLIPSSQAYGLNGSLDPNTGVYAIPPFSALDYSVEVVAIIE